MARGGWITVLTLLAPALAGAQPDPVEIHGFVSQGAMWTSRNNYLDDTERGSFEFSDAGINFTSQPTDRLRVGLQLFSRDLGPIGNYDVKLDWYYLDYRWRDWLGIRAGRVKLPFGLFTDTSDIDAARVPILLPTSLYPAENRQFLLAQTGVELYGRLDLASAGALEYRLYGGTVFVDLESADPSIVIRSIDVPYLLGGRLLWETPTEGLRLGVSAQALRLDFFVDLADTPVELGLPAVLAVASAEYATGELQLVGEYSRWFTDIRSSEPSLFPPGVWTTSERGYAMATYRATPLVWPGVYYSILFPDIRDRQGRERAQHDVAATVRLDLDTSWLLKLEAHYMHGTALLSPALNDGRPKAELDADWLLLLAKATASF